MEPNHTHRIRLSFDGIELKEWFENGLEELAEIVAVAQGGFSVMDNRAISRKAARPQSRKRTEEAIQGNE
jgi:hypothetical protein